MAQVSASLLRGWRRVWQVPELWVLATQQADADADEVARLVAAHEGRVLSPREVLAKLIELGEFAAAEEILDFPAFRAAATVDLQERIRKEDLPRGRQAAYLEAANRYLSLCGRAQRVGLPLPESPAVLAHRSRRAAAERLAQIEENIRDWEKPLIANLERRLAARITEDCRPTAAGMERSTLLSTWESAVRAALESRDLALAAALLEQRAGAHYDPVGNPAPHLPLTAPLPLLLDWFLERVPHPPGIEGFLPSLGDQAARSMLSALAELMRLEPIQWELSDVVGFVEALTEFLGVRILGPVGVGEDGFSARISALAAPGVPALGPAALPHGLDLLIPRTVDSVPPTAKETLMAVFLPERVPVHRAGVLRFNGADLLSLCALPGTRAAGLARILAADLPLDRALPWTAPRSPENHRCPLPDPSTLLGREVACAALQAQSGLSILVGGPGSGRTTLQRWYTACFAPEAVLHLSGVEVLTRDLQLPDGIALLVVDDADRPDAAAGDAVEERLLALLGTAGPALRAVMTRRWRWTEGADPQVLCLGPLSFADARQLVHTLLDPLNVRLDAPQSLDRVTFLAGGNPALLMALLDAILARCDRGPRWRNAVSVSMHDVVEAWNDPVFREDAAAILESAFRGHEELRRTLAAMVVASNYGTLGEPFSASLDDVSDALELIEGVAPDSRRLMADLGALTQMGLIQPGERLRLPLSGIAEICTDVVRTLIGAV